MYTIHLTVGELEFLRNQMQLTAMNETGSDADFAASIAVKLDDEIDRSAQITAASWIAEFEDLFPAGGRE